MSFETRVLATSRERESVATEWEGLRAALGSPSIFHHPNWLESELLPGSQRALTGRALALYEKGQLVAVAPFLEAQRCLPCRLGYWSLLRIPLRTISLLGGGPLTRPEPGVPEAVFEALDDLGPHYDAIYIEGVRVDSPLWGLVHDSISLRRRFWLYLPALAVPRRRIEIEGSFERYLAGFSGRTRQTLRYKMRRLEKAWGEPLVAQRIATASDLEGVRDEIVRVSALSWQGRRLGQQVDDGTVHRLLFWADQGWLRSYTLGSGGRILAFVLAFQSDGVFHYEQPGFDPAWAAFSPGTALLYRVIDDLFGHDQPRQLDFGEGENEYKRLFATHADPYANLYLVRKRLYPGLAVLAHRGFVGAGRATRRLLDRLHLREAVRRRLRGRPSPEPSASERIAETGSESEAG